MLLDIYLLVNQFLHVYRHSVSEDEEVKTKRKRILVMDSSDESDKSNDGQNVPATIAKNNDFDSDKNAYNADTDVDDDPDKTPDLSPSLLPSSPIDGPAAIFDELHFYILPNSKVSSEASTLITKRKG